MNFPTVHHKGPNCLHHI